MKKIYGLILATMLSTAVLAQVATNEPTPPTPAAAPDASAMPSPPPTPPEAGATNMTGTAKSKAKKSAKKKTIAKKKSGLPTSPAMPPPAPLVTNEPAMAVQNNINIRGQAHINSEVIGHLKKGDTVTVLEVVTLKHPKTDEPAKWARIALPGSVHVWINARYIDLLNDLVSAHKLNLRTGPGENYSVIGMLHKGDAIKQLSTKGEWTEIEPPTNAFGFVAAHLLSPAAPAPVPPPVVTTPAPAPTTTIVDNSTPIAPAATEIPGSTNTSTTPPVAIAPAPPPVPVAPPAPAVEEPLPKRVVQREGIVGGTASIQAPSHYELRSLDNGEVMDYLYTTSTNVPMKLYKGLTVYVTGEEELDERWPNTPVITIQKIQVVK